MPQTEQRNNQWHSDHFIFFLLFLFFFCVCEGETICSFRTRLKAAAAIWIIHFSNCNTLLGTFGLALKAYLMTWSSVFPSQPREDNAESPERGIWELSLCLAHCLCWGLSPLKYMGLPMLYSQLCTSYHLYLWNNPDWHRDCPLPYHMGECVRSTGTGFICENPLLNIILFFAG